MKLDFSDKLKSADTLQLLDVAASALRGNYITESGRHLAADAIEDYIRIKRSITGRPRVHKTDAAKSRAWRERERAKNKHE